MFYRTKKHNAIVLRDTNGDIVDSNDNAETMAEYFEKVQWAVRPIEPLPQHAQSADQQFDINCGPVQFVEVREAACQMKTKKQCGSDDIPSEFLQAICLPGSAAADWIMRLFETIWAKKEIPHE